MTTLVWFRSDLRLADNSALAAAVATGGAVIPVFIWAPEEEAPWAPGAASRWWLHQSLAGLDQALRGLGSRLILRQGESLVIVQALAKETGATAVHWNRRYEPAVLARDSRVDEALRAAGMEVRIFNGALLHDPTKLRTQSGKPFRVFTPFWKCALRELSPAEPTVRPRRLATPASWPKSLPIETLGLEPGIDWAGGIRAAWEPGEDGAHKQLERFRRDGLEAYDTGRDRADLAGTSQLSPHLHFGEISPGQVWHAVRHTARSRGVRSSAWQESQFVTELGWREFAHHLLFHFPHTPDQPLRAEFENFPWREGGVQLKAWQKGTTGYPLVDAGMRQLWTMGWMHNRLRMLVASFLVKDLLVSWQEGARWFWDTLVDSDLAQNTLGWQWTAGCGADAAPYFRVFNPVGQAAKLDPSGAYVRRWCPELAKLPTRYLHEPWRAPREVLASAGVELGRTYPERVVQHSIAREIALEAFARMKQMTGPSVHARKKPDQQPV